MDIENVYMKESVKVKKTMKRLLLIITSLIIITALSVLFFFTSTPSFTGVILEINKSSIWVVEASAHNIKNKPDDELYEKYKYQGIVFQLPSYIPELMLNEFSRGQEVKIYYSGEVRESAPAGGDAYWVTTFNK
ncbi:DUF3221 domain-containing protein [Niallia taxi]|uniref:DUF3221 domain-containing protein n=1 Tax=Niallia taxi TaxID=2499688 RepID=UPI002E2126FE|nr:DUF3221 domain-containing protein [Niallia taxi]